MHIREAVDIMSQGFGDKFQFPQHWDRWEAMSWLQKTLVWLFTSALVGFFCIFVPLMRGEGRNTFRGHYGGTRIYRDMLCGRRTNMTQLLAALGKKKDFFNDQ